MKKGLIRPLPKLYILKHVKLRDWLLIYLATVISTTVALFDDINMGQLLWRTFAVACTVFLFLYVFDGLIYIIEGYLKELARKKNK